MPPKASAYDDIFGGSDLSDVEEDQVPRPGGVDDDAEPELDSDEEADRQEAAEEARLLREAGEGDDDDDETRDGDYQADKEVAKGLPSFRKDGSQKRAAVDGEERPKKRIKKKKPTRSDLNDDDVAPHMPIDPVAERAARLDAILTNKKKKAPRKRKPGEEDLDELADEEVYRLRQAMDAAAENDRDAVGDGRPAIEKLKLLPEVVAVLQKGHLETTILEADILTQIRRWLEPIGKAMPALNIQRALLEALMKMDIESSQLKASELGKIVLFYTKHPKLDSQIKRLADQLIMNWMRPIIRRSAQMRDRQVQRAEPGTARTVQKARGIPAASAEKTDIGRRHAAIPQAITTAYTVAPISRIASSQDMGPKGSARFKGMKARLDASRQESKRM